MNIRSIIVVFLFFILAVDLCCAWRRRRAGFLNNDAKIPEKMTLQKTRQPADENTVEKEISAIYKMLKDEESKEKELYRRDSFGEDDYEL